MILDGYTRGWSGVLHDPIKLALGGVSIAYDLVFVIQHFVLYTDRKDPAAVVCPPPPSAVRFHAPGTARPLREPLLLPPPPSATVIHL